MLVALDAGVDRLLLSLALALVRASLSNCETLACGLTLLLIRPGAHMRGSKRPSSIAAIFSSTSLTIRLMVDWTLSAKYVL